MRKIFGLLKRVSPLFLSIFILSCGEESEAPVANFDTSKIEGEYSVNLIIDYEGTRPEVSIFNGSLMVDMINSERFTLAIDFEGDYFTDTLSATIVEKIVANSNSAIGGLNFTVDDTNEYQGNPDKIEVTTRDGLVKKAYAIFIDLTELEMNLHLIEKGDSPNQLKFTATKVE